MVNLYAKKVAIGTDISLPETDGILDVHGIEDIKTIAKPIIEAIASEVLPNVANDNDVNFPRVPDNGALGIVTQTTETIVSKEYKKNNKEIVFTQPLIDTAIVVYGLADVIKAVPPSMYCSENKKSVKASIQQLLYDLTLKPVLMAVPKRIGAHPGKGLPSKTALLKYLYGLERYDIDLIEDLDEKWVKKTIKWAFKKERPVTRHTVVTLKKQCENKRKEAKKMVATEAKNKFYATLVENPQKASKNQEFKAAIVDLIQAPDKFDPAKMTLPLVENALVLVAVLPKELQQAMNLLKTWGLNYVDNIVWNRGRIKAGYVWSKNQHTNILIAVKGSPENPIDYLRLESVNFEPQVEDQKNLPDYYYSTLSILVPGGAYLEVFSTRQFNDQWFTFDPQEADNV